MLAAEITLLKLTYTHAIAGEENVLTMRVACNGFAALVANSTTVRLSGLTGSPTESGPLAILRSTISVVNVYWHRSSGTLSFRVGEDVLPYEQFEVSWSIRNPTKPQSPPPGASQRPFAVDFEFFNPPFSSSNPRHSSAPC